MSWDLEDDYEFVLHDVGDENVESEDKLFDTLKYGESYSVLQYSTMSSRLQHQCDDIAETLAVSSEVALYLLLFYKFEREVIFSEWEKSSKACCSAAGITLESDHIKKLSPTGSSYCEVMMMDYENNEMISLNCGHSFSVDAYQQYVEAIKDEKEKLIFLTCMKEKCKEIILNDIFEKISPATLLQRKRVQTEKFVESCKNYSWCPGVIEFIPLNAKESKRPSDPKKMRLNPNEYQKRSMYEESLEVILSSRVEECSCVFYAPDVRAAINATCTQNHIFCLKCKTHAHEPAPCKLIESWMQSVSLSWGTSAWIKQNTKPCPQCNVNIEKNQGCNHMTCSRCRFEFCWMCSGDWNKHQRNNAWECGNVPRKAESKNQFKSDGIDIEQYIQLWKDSLYSCRFQKNLLPTIDSVFAPVLSAIPFQVDLQFLHAAGEIVVKGRRALAWTYVLIHKLRTGEKHVDKEKSSEVKSAKQDGLASGKGSEMVLFSHSLLSEQVELLQELLEKKTMLVIIHGSHGMDLPDLLPDEYAEVISKKMESDKKKSKVSGKSLEIHSTVHRTDEKRMDRDDILKLPINRHSIFGDFSSIGVAKNLIALQARDIVPTSFTERYFDWRNQVVRMSGIVSKFYDNMMQSLQ
jgi:ariadne-1